MQSIFVIRRAIGILYIYLFIWLVCFTSSTCNRAIWIQNEKRKIVPKLLHVFPPWLIYSQSEWVVVVRGTAKWSFRLPPLSSQLGFPSWKMASWTLLHLQTEWSHQMTQGSSHRQHSWLVRVQPKSHSTWQSIMRMKHIVILVLACDITHVTSSTQ